jgi:hypothetical protein
MEDDYVVHLVVSSPAQSQTQTQAAPQAQHEEGGEEGIEGQLGAIETLISTFDSKQSKAKQNERVVLERRNRRYSYQQNAQGMEKCGSDSQDSTDILR